MGKRGKRNKFNGFSDPKWDADRSSWTMSVRFPEGWKTKRFKAFANTSETYRQAVEYASLLVKEGRAPASDTIGAAALEFWSYLQALPNKDNTLRIYRHSYGKYIAPEWDEQPVVSLARRHQEIAAWAKGKPDRAFVAFQALCAWLNEHERIAHNPFRQEVVRKAKRLCIKSEEKIQLLTTDMMTALLYDARISNAHRLRYALHLLAGLRGKEATALTFEHIVIYNGILCINVERQLLRMTNGQPVFSPPKGRKVGYVPIHPILAGMLRHAAMGRKGSDPIIQTYKGSWNNGDGNEELWRDLKRVGLGEAKCYLRREKILSVSQQGMGALFADGGQALPVLAREAPVMALGTAPSIKTLRNTFACLLADAGAPDTAIGQLLRHSPASLAGKRYEALGTSELNSLVLSMSIPQISQVEETARAIPTRTQEIAPVGEHLVTRPSHKIS